jgi:predicted RNA-binding Zn-ribbon protein involved in translation (DUF1610 family)
MHTRVTGLTRVPSRRVATFPRRTGKKSEAPEPALRWSDVSAGEPNARTAECGVCGAPLVIDVRNNIARCGACGAVAQNFSVDGGSRYRPALDDENAVERFELDRAQGYRDRSRGAYLGFWLVCLVIVSGYWMVELTTALSLGRGGFFDLGALLLTMLVVNRCALMLASKRPAKIALDPVDVPAMTRCTSCGADVLFPAGASTVTCPFCGATVMEPREIEQSRLDRVKRRVAQATVVAEMAEFGGEAPSRSVKGLLGFVGFIAVGLLFLAVYKLAGHDAQLNVQQMSFVLLVAASIGVGFALVTRNQ